MSDFVSSNDPSNLKFFQSGCGLSGVGGLYVNNQSSADQLTVFFCVRVVLLLWEVVELVAVV